MEEIKTKYDTPFLEDVSNLGRMSSKIVRVRCQLDLSDICTGETTRKYYSVCTVMERHKGVYMCLRCSNKFRNLGKESPTFKETKDKTIYKTKYDTPFLEDVSGLTRGMHKKVLVRCQIGIADKCPGEVMRSYFIVYGCMVRSNGIYMCQLCHLKLKHVGRNSSACKYKTLDESFFEQCDTEEKAYFLGWVASDGSCGKKGEVCIKIKDTDIECLTTLRDIACKELPIKTVIEKDSDGREYRSVHFRISSNKVTDDFCKLLNVERGKKSYTIRFPALNPDMMWPFMRGYFDGDGHIKPLEATETNKGGYTRLCSISSRSTEMLKDIQTFARAFKIESSIHRNDVIFSGINALKFLKRLYGSAPERLRLRRKYERFQDYIAFVPGRAVKPQIPNCRYAITAKHDFRLEDPEEDRYGLWIIKVDKVFPENVIRYDTCIKIEADEGYEVAVVCIPPEGYVYIQPPNRPYTYRESIKIALRKTNPEAPDIELPCQVAQVFLRTKDEERKE